MRYKTGETRITVKSVLQSLYSVCSVRHGCECGYAMSAASIFHRCPEEPLRRHVFGRCLAQISARATVDFSHV